MRAVPTWIRMAVAVIGTLVPALGSAIAWRLFWILGAPARVRPSEQEAHDRARVSDFELRDGATIKLYEWGSGERTVALVHGWRSRASRFATIIDALEQRGVRVVSFDAPGNGDSTGERTTALDYAAIIAELGRRYGRFEAIIAHSLGATSSFIAKREGVSASRMVTIAGMHDFSFVIEAFAAAISLPRRATRGLRRRVERWAARLNVDPWRYVVTELDPTDTTTPILVVHDSDDREVPIEQAMQIIEAHTGSVDTLVTDGLGHNRILSDPAVVARVVDFALAGVKSRR